MVIFNEKQAPTFRKYEAKLDLIMNYELLRTFYSHFNFLVALLFRFCFRKVAWKLKSKFSEFFLPLKETVVVPLSEQVHSLAYDMKWNKLY